MMLQINMKMTTFQQAGDIFFISAFSEANENCSSEGGKSTVINNTFWSNHLYMEMKI